MGQCYYVREDDDVGVPMLMEFPSEVWMDPAAGGRLLARGHHTNTTLGIWMYELHAQKKDDLRRRLLRLVEYVCSSAFKPDIEEIGAYMRARLAEREERGVRCEPQERKRIRAPTPAAHLRQHLEQLGISVEALAEHAHVDAGGILDGHVRVDADAALRLGATLGTSAALWLRAQMWCDLDAAEDSVEELPVPLVMR